MTVQTRCQPWLGTFVEVTCDSSAAIDAAFAAVAKVHAAMNVHDSASELSRLNAASGAVCVSPDLATVIARALHWATASGGAFDPAVTGDWRDVAINARTVRFAAPLRLDLSGIAKGFAVDQAVAVMQAAGASAGLVNAGGDMRGFGATAWPVTLVSPDTRAPLGQVSLSNAALATSAARLGGDTSHLRHRAAALVSASVEAPTCIDADALAKIVLAGSRHAAACLAQVDARALALDADGTVLAA